MEYISNSVEETGKIAQKIIDELEGQNVILLQGELGAGKTTFAQGVLKIVGAKGPFTSPTFVIMKCYSVGKLQITNCKLQINSKVQKFKSKNLNPKFVYHIDCYRVGAKDILELGWEEIIKDKNNLVLVEWPEKIKSILPKSYLQVEFKILEENKRRISILEKI